MDRRLAGIGCGLLAALIWGGFPVMTRLGVARSALDAYDVTFLRFAASGLLLLPVLLRRGLGGLGAGPVALMVAGIGAPYMLVIAAGLTRAPVGLFAALTPGSMIAFSAILGVLAIGERPSGRRLAGLLLILAGIVVTGSADLPGSGGSAVALFLLGGLLWAVYTVTTRACAVEPLRATAIVSVVSAALYAPAYLAVRGGALLAMPLPEVAAQAVYQGVLVSVAALYFYSKSVALLGPTVGASFAALVPVLAVLEASLLLGESPPASSLAGLVVVTLGMATILAGSRREPRPS